MTAAPSAGEDPADGRRVRTLLVDAFTEEPTAGNGAGVVPDADGLTPDQMRRVAAELGQSETAFVLPSGSADRRVRYFTPQEEVDLCGHATIATHAHLHADGVVEAGTHSLETEVGVLDVRVESGGTVWMTQDAPEVREVDLDYETVGAALGVDPATMRDVGADLPLAVTATGLPFLAVPVNFLDSVGSAAPDFDAVERLCDSVDARGVYLFTFDALSADATLHGRCFVPSAGVPEDPVTGTASGAVGAYLRRYGAFDEVPEEMVFEQGHYLDRPGRVRVRAREEIEVGGRAVTTLDGDLRVPPADDDDIIEA
jgi:PhzF family phenazine biosynthesis protein